MKFSWKTLVLWTLPPLVIGFFFWQGAFATVPADTTKNTASTRMTYGRFLEYIDSEFCFTERLYRLSGVLASFEAILINLIVALGYINNWPVKVSN